MLMMDLTETLKNMLHIDNENVILLIYSIVLAFVLELISKIITGINRKINLNEKQIYTSKKTTKSIFSIIYAIALIFIWHRQLNGILTFISITSAALTLAVREIIYNYFSGIYIRLKKPIKVEDRILVESINGNTIGDVVNINALSFEILEVNTSTNQSTGIIVHVPNSAIFSYPVKNYTSVFKYIWDEININVELDTEIDKAKEIVLNILNANETIMEVPKKTKRELNKSSADYRIYYNNFTPIIYTKISEEKIVLSARFLIHPKKQRVVESEIYESILKEFKENNIKLK